MISIINMIPPMAINRIAAAKKGVVSSDSFAYCPVAIARYKIYSIFSVVYLMANTKSKPNAPVSKKNTLLINKTNWR